ncbi:piggyBac transposable element-derived protein 4-like [Chrysoperla carnea]|uniref:piggyBac transposable element-derived protein 4-like n=1 Tax=Chrysoperla carnea TaxID=189513 RepID=UPI001D06F595|nr:piggyBac transposable element-derived protein 4-like [Chrysoperla carnea]
MAKRQLTESEIQRALVESDDENFFVRENDRDEENFSVDSCSDSDSNVTEPASENDDEQLWSESDDVPLQEYVSIDTYKGRDGTTWKSEPDRQRRTPRHNIIRGGIHKVILPPGQAIIDPIDSFSLFFDDHVLEIIVKYTNTEGLRVLQNRWKSTDKIEMQAFLGLLLTIGVNKQGGVDFREYWDPIFGNPIFRATMGKNRFASLLRNLRFDDKNTRSLRKSKDKLAPIRELWEYVNQNLKKFYLPGENLTIDEQLVPFRGRVSFKQYLPSKPDKYGMKIWWICDSKTSYPLFGIPYLGKEGQNRAENLAYNVVNQLCEPYFRSNRNVTFDNYFTSIDVAKSLAQNGLTIVGTLRKNKACIPPNFLVSYVPKKNRAVIFLSTMHHGKEVNVNKNNKSEINLYYNSTKGAVDTLDQMVHEYTVRRKTNRWPMAFFQNIIDVVGIASLIIWKNIHPDWNSRKKNTLRKRFLREIAIDLVTPHIRRRSMKGLSSYHLAAMQ